MKLIRKEKKEYTSDKIMGIIWFLVYTACLIYIRFSDFFENRMKESGCQGLFIIVSMVAVVIIIFTNYLMCRNGLPDKNLYNEINNFDMRTNNKNDIIEQREILFELVKEKKIPPKSRKIVYFIEVLVCIIGFFMYEKNVDFTNTVMGLVVDFETALMALWFSLDIHYKFKIDKNLGLSD